MSRYHVRLGAEDLALGRICAECGRPAVWRQFTIEGQRTSEPHRLGTRYKCDSDVLLHSLELNADGELSLTAPAPRCPDCPESMKSVGDKQWRCLNVRCVGQGNVHAAAPSPVVEG